MENNSLKITVEGLHYTHRKHSKRMLRTFPDLDDWMEAACSAGTKAANERVMQKNPGTFAKGYMKRRYERIAEEAINNQAKGEHINGKIFFYYDFYETNTKRGPSNIAAFFIKVFEDALQNCGVIDDDGWNIAGYACYFHVDKYLPRVEVTINALEPKKNVKPEEKKETESE